MTLVTTEHLIDQLAGTVRRSSPGAASRRLAAGIAVGAAISLLLILAALGRPAASVQYTGIPAFTMKLSFSAAMAAAAAVLLYLSGHPGHRLGNRLYWIAVPPALVAVTALMEMTATAPQYREQVWLGSTSHICLAAVTLLSLPILAGVSWAFRRLAPTRLRVTGFLAGTVAGSVAAIIYALYCPETTASFLVTWYSLAIGAAGLVGLLLGPRLLKW
ncbi:MAG: DUF1109 domain-containing protein [Sphingomonas sp.]|nr:DUF1109 domain-containing protein [Sphingomonas sp.]